LLDDCLMVFALDMALSWVGKLQIRITQNC
jgi:hypothetical protein